MYAQTLENAMPRLRPRREDRVSWTSPGADAGATPFVGRSDAQNELSGLLARTRQARGGLALIAGEPGIGKSRLALEVMRSAQAHGMPILFGACWEHEGRPPFSPWIQILRAVADELSEATTSKDARPQAVLVALTSALSCETDGAHEPAVALSMRFAMLERVADCLRALSKERPLLVVLDDLQWADDASLLLLRFLATDLEQQAIAVIGTLRDVELDATHPSAKLLSELATRATPVALRGLCLAEVAQLAQQCGASSLDTATASALHARSGGNPFFVRELLRAGALREDLGAARPTPGIAHVLERRLQHLGAPCRAMLSAASVIAPHFSPGMLRCVLGSEGAHAPLEELLTEAIAARLLERGAANEDFSFAHALVREACYAQLGPAAARALHRRAAEAIAQRHALDLDAHHAELAMHYGRAGESADLAKALHHLECAAHAAEARSAHGDAAQSLRRALDLLERLGSTENGRRAGLLLKLGVAEMNAGRSERGRAALREAAAIASVAGDGVTLARAALSFGVPLAVGKSDFEEVELLTRAQRCLDAGDSALRAALLARLATALMFATEQRRCTELSDQALAMARRVGDAGTLARVLATRHQTRWDGGFADERRALIYQRIACMALLCVACHRLGDGERARALYRLMLPFQRYHVRVTRHGTTTLGSAEQFLGMLALTTGETERAITHLEAAVHANRRLGFAAMLASSLRRLADALAARGAPSDTASRERALFEADSLAHRFGVAPLFERGARAGLSRSRRISASQVPQTRFCREGEYWLIEHEGTSVRLRDSVGMQLLARLLAEPNREFAAIELRGDGGPAARTGDAGPVLDERALAAYKRRRDELAGELAEAEAWGDPARTSAVQHELAVLEHELSRALGFGGKPRRVAASLERARVTVTKALRGTVLRLARQHRSLGDHLDRSVRTGHICVYRPDLNHPIAWQVSAA